MSYGYCYAQLEDVICIVPAVLLNLLNLEIDQVKLNDCVCQVYACIREAMDAAQEAAAARDKLLDQQAESHAELKSLRAKSTRQAAAIAAAADAEERVLAAEAKCKAAHADASSWQTKVGLQTFA